MSDSTPRKDVATRIAEIASELENRESEIKTKEDELIELKNDVFDLKEELRDMHYTLIHGGSRFQKRTRPLTGTMLAATLEIFEKEPNKIWTMAELYIASGGKHGDGVARQRFRSRIYDLVAKGFVQKRERGRYKLRNA